MKAGKSVNQDDKAKFSLAKLISNRFRDDAGPPLALSFSFRDWINGFRHISSRNFLSCDTLKNNRRKLFTAQCDAALTQEKRKREVCPEGRKAGTSACAKVDVPLSHTRKSWSSLFGSPLSLTLLKYREYASGLIFWCSFRQVIFFCDSAN